MQRVWAAVLSVWAMLAMVAVLAWTHHPPAPPPAQAVSQTVLLKTAHGKQRFVVVQAAQGPPHATTSTSAVVR
jgi:hypothetical protein